MMTKTNDLFVCANPIDDILSFTLHFLRIICACMSVCVSLSMYHTNKQYKEYRTTICISWLIYTHYVLLPPRSSLCIQNLFDHSFRIIWVIVFCIRQQATDHFASVTSAQHLNKVQMEDKKAELKEKISKKIGTSICVCKRKKNTITLCGHC